MLIDEIRGGSIVRGNKWPEPVEVNLVEKLGGHIHIVGANY